MRGIIAPTRGDYTDIEGQGLTMYSNEEIMQFVNIVVEVSDPDKIILFGSYAYGNPNDKSDLDVLVIKNGKNISFDDEAKLAVAIFRKRSLHSIGTQYDLFIRSEGQVRKFAKKGGAMHDAVQRGKVVYERTH